MPLSGPGSRGAGNPYLFKALLDCMVNQVTLVNGYLNVLAAEQDWQSSRTWFNGSLTPFLCSSAPHTPSFLDKTEAVFWTYAAELSLHLGDRNQPGPLWSRPGKWHDL